MQKQIGASRFLMPFVSADDETTVDIESHSVCPTRINFICAYGGNLAFKLAGAHALKISKLHSKKWVVPRLIQFDYFHSDKKQSLKSLSNKVKIEEMTWLDLRRLRPDHKLDLKNYLNISDEDNFLEEFQKRKELLFEAFEKFENLRGIVHLQKINEKSVWVTTMRMVKENITNAVVVNSKNVVKI